MSGFQKGLKVSITANSIDIISYDDENTNYYKHINETCNDSTGSSLYSKKSQSRSSTPQSVIDDDIIEMDHVTLSDEEVIFDTPENSDEDIDSEARKARDKYIKYMESVVEQLKAMRWGDTLSLDADPNNLSNKKRYCVVSKNVRFSTYIFKGKGSKNLLRYFMNKTKDDPEYAYTKIVQILNSKSYRQFMPIRDWKQLWKAYKSEPIEYRHLFEVIRSDQPCKPYLDIEWLVDHNQDATKIDHNEFIEELTNDIIIIFDERYGINIDDDDILISTSHSKNKVSFHVVVDKEINGKTVAYRTNRKGLPESAWDLWVALVEHDESYEEVNDEAVYSTDREFRALYSNKTSDFRPVVPYGAKIKKSSKIKLNTKQCMRYLVTHSTKDEYYYIATPEISKKYLVVNKKYYYDGIYVPKIYTDKKINELMGLIRPHHPSAEYTGRSACGTGWRFSYEDKNELCYTGHRHTSNGFYVFEDENRGIIYMKCMSTSCKGIQILKRTKSRSSHPTKKLF